MPPVTPGRKFVNLLISPISVTRFISHALHGPLQKIPSNVPGGLP